LDWGVSPTQLLGPIPEGKDRYPDFRDLVHAEDRTSFLAAGRQAMAQGSQYYHEFRIVMTDGAVRWVAARGELMRDDAGRVVRMLGTTMDITRRRHDEARIHELAFFDQLTGLPNRTLLLDRMKQAMTANARNGSHAALLFIDLDNFKALNDSCGHDMGDLLLKQVAQRLTACVRAGDTVARFGGDEFIVVLTGLGGHMTEAAAQAETVARKILVALNRIYQLGEVAHHCTPSIGATLFAGQQHDADLVLKQADSAMYRAKEAGRNTLRFFAPGGESDSGRATRGS
jgi:diguanylate cyclase (GGDEF)-like protein